MSGSRGCLGERKSCNIQDATFPPLQSGSHPWTVSLVKEVCWCSGRLAKKSDELTKGEFEQFTVIISIMLAHDTWSVVCLFVCLLHCYACPKCPNGSALHAESPGVDPSQQGGPRRGALWSHIGLLKSHTLFAQLLHLRCLVARIVPRDLVPSDVISKDENNMRPLLVQLLGLPEALLCLTTKKKQKGDDGCYFHPLPDFVQYELRSKDGSGLVVPSARTL